MSTLLIDELYPSVEFEQKFKITRDVNLAHIRLWIFKSGTLQTGVLTCEVYDGIVKLAESTIDYTTFNATFDQDYAEGFIRFDFTSLTLRIPQGSTEYEYTLKFSMQGHTLDTNNYVAVSRQWEDKIYTTYGDGVVGNQAQNDYVEPVGIEFYEYSN